MGGVTPANGGQAEPTEGEAFNSSALEGRLTDTVTSVGSTHTKILFHILFGTKNRASLLTEVIRPRLFAFMGGIIRKQRGILHQVGGTSDHVHLLIGWRADETIATLMRELKARSSRWIHETFPAMREFHWQDGYTAFSVSQSQMERVRQYIAEQRKHHRSRDFRRELTELLRAHGVEFDERYL